jgi:tetratricopeptide (TPR) repeat protein
MIENKINIILNYFKVGDFKYVIKETIKLSNKNPNNSYLKNLLGLAYLETGAKIQAVENFSLAIKLNPKNISALNNLGNAFKYLNKYEQSEKFYLRALNLNPNFIDALNNYGNLKHNINQPYEAITLLNKALSINENNYKAAYNLALVYQSIGEFDQTVKYARKTLELEPRFTKADKLLSVYNKYQDESDKHLIEMQKKIFDKSIISNEKVNLHFSLSKAFENIGNIKKSISHLEAGNELKNSLIKYDIKDDLKIFNLIKKLFNNLDFNSLQLKHNSSKFIFVVGMPRSGTSLIERIVSSHDQVFGAGELPFLADIILSEINNHPKDLQSFFSEKKNLNSLAESYLDKVSIIKNNGKVILDKSLLNFLWIGFIKILFPHAKIIHVKRNAKDTCLSCYKNLFDNNLNFTYKKSDLTSFYYAYLDLMNFWEKTLTGSVYTINYEDVIKDPKKNISDLLAFCNLNYNEKCLNFHKNKSPVKTMSASQVTKKIYSTSIHSYKKYQDYIPDLFENLP